jgi:Holliday junction resolvase-like predicted endonuclease
VTLEKQRRIFRAAQEYIGRRRLGAARCRFDVVSVLERDGATEVDILRGAFDEPAPRASRR